MTRFAGRHPDDLASPTIYAPATAPGAAAIAVIRLSGPDAANVVRALAGSVPSPREAALRRLKEPQTGETIDSALVLWFPAPHSYTGEDVAEFHVHGGAAVVDAVLGTLSGLPRLRLAEPGEFTRRAFENGKLDLTAAEGVADLVAARTAGQRRQALAQVAGDLGRLYDTWRHDLIRMLALLEADIDFPDEDLPEGLTAEARELIERTAREIAVHIDDGHRGERIRDGFRIAIIGAPNAGKSSLLNRLAKRDAAIVSATAGTTRDVVEVRLDIAGYEVILADTAGLRDSTDEIEQEGVRRARAAAAAADMKLAVMDGTAWPRIDPAVRALLDEQTWLLLNKADLMVDGGADSSAARGMRRISALTGAGIDALMVAIAAEVSERLGMIEAPALTRMRHREALAECGAALHRAMRAPAAELAAEDVRIAVRALGRITGRVDIDDVLDVIFRDFCIGK
jgi:tRNA modification GTPase